MNNLLYTFYSNQVGLKLKLMIIFLLIKLTIIHPVQTLSASTSGSPVFILQHCECCC